MITIIFLTSIKLFLHHHHIEAQHPSFLRAKHDQQTLTVYFAKFTGWGIFYSIMENISSIEKCISKKGSTSSKEKAQDLNKNVSRWVIQPAQCDVLQMSQWRFTVLKNKPSKVKKNLLRKIVNSDITILFDPIRSSPTEYPIRGGAQKLRLS